jgi:prepilin-type N-terminal cleavage/methylation domain-containing protein
MDRDVLMKGFSLIELSIVMAVAAILAAAATPVVIRSVEVKAGEKTALEITYLQDIARKFYVQHDKTWPQDLSALRQAGYVNPQWDGRNAWGSDYLVSDVSGLLFVSTDVPQNMTGLVSMRVPMASVSGKTVTSSIGIYDGSAGGIDPGVIVAWSGTIDSIPKGWVLCDGTNGTPDLRDKFIVGARQDDQGTAKTTIMGSLSKTGGAISHDHGGTTGSHALTIAEMPSHHLDVMVNDTTTSGGSARYPETVGVSSLKPYPTTSIGGDQPHTHSITGDFNVPPFYALAFIMKLP